MRKSTVRPWYFIIFTLSLIAALRTPVQAQFPSDFLFGDHLTGTDFTIAGWFQTSQVQTTDVALFSNKNWGSGGNPGFIFTVDADGAQNEWKVNANAAGGTRIDTDWVPAPLNQWMFIAATFDRDGVITAYTNGVAGSNTPSSPTGLIDTADSPFFFDFNIGQDGTGNYGNGQGFHGLVDDVGVWRRALDSTELAGLHAQALSGAPLGSLFGTSLNGGANVIDSALVGYYAFENNLNDGAGTPQHGIARTAPGNPGGAVAFAPGRNGFGQALVLDGSAYVTIGDAVPPGDATFNGNSPLNNLASNPANWDLSPASLSVDQGMIIVDGTSAVFSGPHSGPAIFDGTFPNVLVKNLQVGGAGSSTFIEFNSGSNVIAAGADHSVIGRTGSTVSMVFNGNGRLEHRGPGEESTRLIIGQPGSTVDVVMNDTSEMTSGPRIADPAYVTGFRRTSITDPPGTPPRSGDDIMFGEVNDGPMSHVNITMNHDSLMFSPDVFYPGDSNNTLVTVVQNHNSRVLVNWDTRFLDDNGGDVVWTMNHNSKFVVARDHGLGETAGAGSVNLTINDSAQFIAGDRIVLGAGGGEINVTMNSGLMKVGGNSPSDVLLVDPTGEPTPGSEPRAVDWILHMGGGANATLNVKGGAVEVGRSAYIGRGGGQAKMVVDGGSFQVKGVGPIAVGLGNGPGGGVPDNVNWQSNGGDLIIGNDAGDTGTFEFRRGTVDVARDVIVSFDDVLGGGGGEGTLRMVTSSNPVGTDSFTVGRDLSFAGDFFGGSGGQSTLDVVFQGANMVPINVNGDLYVFNDGVSISDFSVSVAPGGLPPTVGQYVVVDYSGNRFGNQFNALPATGLDYNLIYDDANGRVILDILQVNLINGDFNSDGLYDCLDVDALVGDIAGGNNTLSFDLTGDGVVNGADLTAWLAQAGAVNLPSGNSYVVGDANLDGAVDGSDFGVWNANKFTSIAAWCAGDFNADGAVDGSDFGAWNANKFTSADSGAGQVPEPVALPWLIAISAGCLLGRRVLVW